MNANRGEMEVALRSISKNEIWKRFFSLFGEGLVIARRLRAGAILGMVLFIGGGDAIGAPAADMWIKLEANGVTVLSDASPKDATEFMLGYLAYQNAFQQLLALPGRSAMPVSILLFKTRKSLEALDREFGKITLAVTAEVDGEVLFALAVEDGRKAALKTVYEFDTIHRLRRCGYFLPLWVEQGAGAVFSSLRPTKEGVEIGDFDRSALRTLLDKPWLAWDVIDRITTDSAEYNRAESLQMFGAQSRGVMHLVLFRRPEKLREQFLAFVEHAQLVKTPAQTVAAALNIAPENVDAAIKQAAVTDHVVKIPFDREAVRKSLLVGPAKEIEVVVRKATILQARRKSEAAMVEVYRASTLDPKSPAVLEAMARQAMFDSSPQLMAERYREAIAAGSKNPAAYLQSARLRLNGIGGDRPAMGGTAAEEAVAELREALRLKPGDSDLVLMLARALFLSPATTPEDLDELSSALNSRMQGFWVRRYRGMTALRLGKEDLFLADLKVLLADDLMTVDDRKAILREFAAVNFEHTRKSVTASVAREDYAQALKLIDERLNPVRWAIIAADIAGLREWVSVSEALEKLNRLNRAEDREAVRAAMREFIEKFPDHSLSKNFRTRLETEKDGGTPGAAP